jgi:uncharacterized membrane protein
MVTVREQEIIAQPNCSASWRQNQWLLAGFGLCCLFLSLLFYLRGAWLVLPLTGVVLLLFELVLFLTFKKLQQRHILRFHSRQLTLEKTSRHPALRWQLLHSHTRVSVQRQTQSGSPLKIALCTAREYIPLGDFLNCEDSQLLLAELRHRGLMICNDSQAGSLLG